MVRNVKIIGVYLAVIWGLLSYCGVARAEGAGSLETNKNSVVQVVMTCKTQDGKRYILMSGSGIVLNSTTVLTNYRNVHMSQEAKKKATGFIRKQGDSLELSGDDKLEIGIVRQDDVLISAGISQESEDLDFAILSLAEATDRPAAVISKDGAAIMGQTVFGVGYPAGKLKKPDGFPLYQVSDINLVSGVVAETEEQMIRISGKLSSGNSGGALLDAATGELLGLLIYNPDDKKNECYRALSIQAVKHPYLDGLSYTESGEAEEQAGDTEEPVSEEEPGVDKTMLRQCIQRASSLDPSVYTQESYNFVLTWLVQAQAAEVREDISQSDVDFARDNLQRSMENLVLKEEVDPVVIVVIVAASLAVIALIVILVRLLLKMRKDSRERRQFTELPQRDIPDFDRPASGRPAGAAVPSPSGSLSGSLDRSGHTDIGTTVLSMGGQPLTDNATTVLNSTPARQVRAFLVRMGSGEKKVIDGIEMTVGKDPMKSDFCVTDNTAISRCHMKIMRRGVAYVVMDLGSTNYTYLNGERLRPNEEYPLKNGDGIKAADEEFIFEIG